MNAKGVDIINRQGRTIINALQFGYSYLILADGDVYA